MYSAVFRYYLFGKERQAYFDRIIDELETGVDHLMVMANPNWFFYFKKINGKDVLRDTWPGFRARLEQSRDEFVTLYQHFMPSVKTGMPDLPLPEEPKPPKLVALDINHENSLVMTEHADHAGEGERHQVSSLLNSSEDPNSKWFA